MHVSVALPCWRHYIQSPILSTAATAHRCEKVCYLTFIIKNIMLLKRKKSDGFLNTKQTTCSQEYHASGFLRNYSKVGDSGQIYYVSMAADMFIMRPMQFK